MNLKAIAITIMLLSTTLFVVQPFNDSIVKAFSGSGSGTVADPYQITTIDELYEVRNDLSADYILMNDLNFSDVNDYTGADAAANMTDNTTGSGWLPIGTLSDRFTGTLDGNNYTISNLFINRSDIEYVGLFGDANYVELKNIGLLDVNITSSYSVDYPRTAALVGAVAYESTIENCYVVGGNVSSNDVTGGLIGIVSDGGDTVTITECYSNVTVYSTGNFIGGLVGSISDASGGSLIVSNSYSLGNVTGDAHTGGLVGSNDAIINNSYSTGFVSAVSGKLGFLKCWWYWTQHYRHD